MPEFPTLQPQLLGTPTLVKLQPPATSSHPPRIRYGERKADGRITLGHVRGAMAMIQERKVG